MGLESFDGPLELREAPKSLFGILLNLFGTLFVEDRGHLRPLDAIRPNTISWEGCLDF